jgi:hypothetical protein
MDDKKIDSFGALHDAVQENAKKIMIFRGVKDLTYGLVPKVGRYKKFKELSIEALEKEEKTMLRLFRERDRTFVDIDRNPDPFKRKTTSKFIPNHITARITAPTGGFTVHPDPRKPLDPRDIQRWIMPNSSRRR